ncbi:MAG TPA: hypothetical protein VGM50_22945 [Gemmatimonadaceae bacterium]|jgi:hypothetical protein
MMRAKLQVRSVEKHATCEVLKMSPVCSSGFGPNGESEDNTYARYTGKFNPGDAYYVNFTKAE